MVAKEQAQRSDCLGSSPDPTICLWLVNLRPVAFIFLDLRFLIKKGEKKKPCHLGFSWRLNGARCMRHSAWYLAHWESSEIVSCCYYYYYSSIQDSSLTPNDSPGVGSCETRTDSPGTSTGHPPGMAAATSFPSAVSNCTYGNELAMPFRYLAVGPDTAS